MQNNELVSKTYVQLEYNFSEVVFHNLKIRLGTP